MEDMIRKITFNHSSKRFSSKEEENTFLIDSLTEVEGVLDSYQIVMQQVEERNRLYNEKCELEVNDQISRQNWDEDLIKNVDIGIQTELVE